MSINIKINEILEKQGKSRYWLSKEVGMTHQSLTKIARNDTASISFENLEKICKALNCTPNDILGWDDNKK